MTDLPDLSDLPDDEQAVADAAAIEALEQYRKIKAQKADRESRLAEARANLRFPDLTIPVFAANQNSDLTEGKGRSITRGYFFIREDAEEATAMLSGVQGTLNTSPVTELVVYSAVEPWLEQIRGNPNVMMARRG